MNKFRAVLEVGDEVFTPEGQTMKVTKVCETGFYTEERFISYSEHLSEFVLVNPNPKTLLEKYKKLGTVEFLKKELKELKAYRDTRPICCPKCHRGCFDADKFCGHCGASLKGVRR